MKTVRKILTGVSVGALAVCIIMLIGAIFGLKVFSQPLLNVLFTCVIIAVAGAFSINALTMANRNKTLGYVCLGLLTTLSLFLFIILWADITGGLFGKITLFLAITTIFFNIIVSLSLKLEKRYRILQIITYVLVVAVDIVLTLLIFCINVLVSGVWQAFTVACIVIFGLLCALGILGKKTDKETETNTTPKTNTVEQLKARINELEIENAELKQKLAQYEK